MRGGGEDAAGRQFFQRAEIQILEHRARLARGERVRVLHHERPPVAEYAIGNRWGLVEHQQVDGPAAGLFEA